MSKSAWPIRGMMSVAILLMSGECAIALPSWWDSSDKKMSGMDVIHGDPDSAFGLKDILLENEYDEDKTKLVYFILEWWSNDPESRIDMPVSFAAPNTHPEFKAGKLEVDQTNDGRHHWEYSYEFTPQPASEIALFGYYVPLGSSVNYEYDFRSQCVPEPGSFVFAAVAVLAILLRGKGRLRND